MVMRTLMIAIGLAACAPAATRPATAPAPPPAGEPAAPVPTITAEERAAWTAIRAGGALPAGVAADDRVDGLLALLASPEAEIRDGLGYEVLAAWVAAGGALGDAGVDRLRDALVARTQAPIVAGDAVFARSFAALGLAAITAREVAAPRWDDATLAAQLAAAGAYAGRETDLRGYTGAATGWAHAAAHTADWLKFLARHPRLDGAGARRVLDAVVAIAARAHGVRFCHGEDERLAAVIRAVARRELLADAELDAALAALAAPLATGWPSPFDPAIYATQRNARDVLVSAFLALSFDDSPGAQRALARLRALLAR